MNGARQKNNTRIIVYNEVIGGVVAVEIRMCAQMKNSHDTFPTLRRTFFALRFESASPLVVRFVDDIGDHRFLRDLRLRQNTRKFLNVIACAIDLILDPPSSSSSSSTLRIIDADKVVVDVVSVEARETSSKVIASAIDFDHVLPSSSSASSAYKPNDAGVDEDDDPRRRRRERRDLDESDLNQ